MFWKIKFKDGTYLEHLTIKYDKDSITDYGKIEIGKVHFYDDAPGFCADIAEKIGKLISDGTFYAEMVEKLGYHDLAKHLSKEKFDFIPIELTEEELLTELADLRADYKRYGCLCGHGESCQKCNSKSLTNRFLEQHKDKTTT